MRNNNECMLGGVMEEKRGTVRAVHLAGGRSPGRVRSSARVLESRTLSVAALLGALPTLVCILAGACWGSTHGWRRDRELDGARCPPRWQYVAMRGTLQVWQNQLSLNVFGAGLKTVGVAEGAELATRFRRAPVPCPPSRAVSHK